jgi:hypothetical protein
MNLTKIFFQPIPCLINYLVDMSLLNNKLTKVTSSVKLKTRDLILLMNLPHVTLIIRANESNIRSYGFPNWSRSKGSKAVYSCKSQSTFLWNISLLSSGSKCKPIEISMKQAERFCYAYHTHPTGFSHGLLDHQETGDVFLSNFCWLSKNCMTSCHRRQNISDEAVRFSLTSPVEPSLFGEIMRTTRKRFQPRRLYFCPLSRLIMDGFLISFQLTFLHVKHINQ